MKLEGNNSLSVGNVGNDVGNLFKDFITQSEFIIYSIIKENPQISATKIAEEIKLSKRSVERNISSLKEKGYIARDGSTRGKWIILK